MTLKWGQSKDEASEVILTKVIVKLMTKGERLHKENKTEAEVELKAVKEQSLFVWLFIFMGMSQYLYDQEKRAFEKYICA